MYSSTKERCSEDTYCDSRRPDKKPFDLHIAYSDVLYAGGSQVYNRFLTLIHLVLVSLTDSLTQPLERA